MKRKVAVSATPDDPQVYRDKLLEKRAEFMAALDVKFDTVASMGRINEEDQAQLSHDESVSLHLNSLDYDQLRLVQQALDRLDAGDYGTCQSCEEPIAPKRLRALPWARFCINCQELANLNPDLISAS